MNGKYTKAESNYVGWVKSLPCGVCGDSPVEAHHIRQHKHYTVIPLCVDCHRGSHNGIHGRKAMWSIKRIDEVDVLNDTIGKLWQNQS